MNITINFNKTKIQDIKNNDYVVSYDEGKKEISKVVETFSPVIDKNNQLKVTTKNGSFVSSSSHRMFVNNDYKKLSETNIGDLLSTVTGKTEEIIDIEYLSAEDEVFYDIHVENSHSYYINAGNGDFYLSHNSATVNVPIWDYEIEDVLVLKNNSGTDENRVRKLDYVIQFSKLFYERVINGEKITLFSTHECKDLYEKYGTPAFDEAYKAREKDKNVRFRKVVDARALMELFTRERLETGRLYPMNVDNVNSHNSFLEKVWMTNLCCVTGDTSIECLVNNAPLTLTMNELIEYFNEGIDIQVLSKDTETDILSYKPVTQAMLTRKNSELLLIEDDKTGKKIKCTPDHLIFTKNRGYVEAQYLQEDDILDELE